MNKRVLLTDRAWPDVEIERQVLASAGFELICGPAAAAPTREVEALVAEHDPIAIMTCWAPVSDKAIALPSDLKVVTRLGVGLDNIATAAARARGTWVTNVPDYCVEEVSDHALALLLGHFRGIAALDRATKASRWDPTGVRLTRIRDLTIGIIGFGRIGQATARKLAGFGCNLLAVDRHATGDMPSVERVSLSDLQARADAIVLHVPLVDETRDMIDDRFIAACRRRPLLINVGRGGLVDNEALLRALDNGLFSGAALDVITGEPAPPTELLTHPAVIATPHVAFLSTASLLELRRRATEDVVRVLSGEPPLNPCNAPIADAQAIPASFDRGVGSDISVIDGPDGRYVLKKALPRLRVAAEWRSDPARSMVEAAALKAIAQLIGQDAVPRVLWTDPDQNAFGMELIPSRLRNWKRDLMTGRVDLATALRAGQLLGRMHAASATRADLREQFGDTRFFQELRVRPYFNRIAACNPELASDVELVVAGMEGRRTALVHGDFSPKNILADGAEVVILDCEAAHWGDPRFDLAFCLTHLTLKAFRRGAPVARLASAAAALVAGYRETGPEIHDAALVKLLACLILARLEGDSPVEYLTDLDVGAVKKAAVLMLRAPAKDGAALAHPLEVPA